MDKAAFPAMGKGCSLSYPQALLRTVQRCPPSPLALAEDSEPSALVVGPGGDTALGMARGGLFAPLLTKLCVYVSVPHHD